MTTLPDAQETPRGSGPGWAEFWGWSIATREGLVAAGLSPTQKEVVHVICLETFDKGRVRAPLDLNGWARRLKVRDSRGPRPDKLRRVLEELVNFGVADVNSIEGWVELRPNPGDWLEARLLRAENHGATGSAGSTVQGDLPLRAERALSEAMSEVSREKATAHSGAATAPGGAGATVGASEVNSGSGDGSSPRTRALFSRLKGALQCNASDEVYDEIAAAAKGTSVPATAPGGAGGEPPQVMRTSAAESADGAAGKAAGGESGFGGKSRRTQVAFAAPVAIAAGKAATTSIASCSSLKETKLALPTSVGATASRGRGTREAAEWSLRAVRALQGIDFLRELENRRCSQQWTPMLDQEPRYVLEELLPAYERAKADKERKGDEAIVNPIAWLSRKAVAEGKMRPLKKAQRISGR